MKIVIVSNNLFVLDVMMVIEAINVASGDDGYDVEGYYTVNGGPLSFDKSINLNWLGELSSIYKRLDSIINVVVAITEPKVKKRVIDNLRNNNIVKFVSLRAPWTAAPDDFTVGEGTILAAESVQSGTKIGNFVTLYQTMSDAQNVIGDYSTIMGYTNITAAKIGTGVYIGSNCCVLESCTIGEGAIIYPGSLVTRNVAPHSKVIGIPARDYHIFCKRNGIDETKIKM